MVEEYWCGLVTKCSARFLPTSSGETPFGQSESGLSACARPVAGAAPSRMNRNKAVQYVFPAVMVSLQSGFRDRSTGGRLACFSAGNSFAPAALGGLGFQGRRFLPRTRD